MRAITGTPKDCVRGEVGTGLGDHRSELDAIAHLPCPPFPIKSDADSRLSAQVSRGPQHRRAHSSLLHLSHNCSDNASLKYICMASLRLGSENRFPPRP